MYKLKLVRPVVNAFCNRDREIAGSTAAEHLQIKRGCIGLGIPDIVHQTREMETKTRMYASTCTRTPITSP